MKFRYQSYVDVSTSASSMQVLQWSVGGADVINRCRHLFGAYKYFKLGKISVKFIPAATLPVDPQGLSYDEDDPQTVDPRDQMDAGLVRITNGEDIFTDVSSLTDEQQRGIYNTMLLDPRWSKFMLQSGFRRSAYPLYWQVGQLQQDYYPGSTINMPLTSPPLYYPDSVVAQHVYKNTVNDNLVGRTNAGSSSRGLFQVGHRGRLGYLPTDYYQYYANGSDNRFSPWCGLNNVPEVRVITCVLPKAHKTIYYYRVYITEEVIFSGIRSSPPVIVDDSHPLGGQYAGIDNFIYPSIIQMLPGGAVVKVTSDDKMNNGDQQI